MKTPAADYMASIAQLDYSGERVRRIATSVKIANRMTMQCKPTENQILVSDRSIGSNNFPIARE